VQGQRVTVEPGAHALLFGGQLDVNHASVVQLQQLPGVGPGLAARVVQSRESEGPFESVDALDRVSGIGPARVEQVRPYVLAGGVALDPDPQVVRSQ
jgi:competence protein ComEA